MMLWKVNFFYLSPLSFYLHVLPKIWDPVIGHWAGRAGSVMTKISTWICSRFLGTLNLDSGNITEGFSKIKKWMPDHLRSKDIFVAPQMVWIYDGSTQLLNHEAVMEGRREKSLVFTAEAGSSLYRMFWLGKNKRWLWTVKITAGNQNQFHMQRTTQASSWLSIICQSELGNQRVKEDDQQHHNKHLRAASGSTLSEWAVFSYGNNSIEISRVPEGGMCRFVKCRPTQLLLYLNGR